MYVYKHTKTYCYSRIGALCPRDSSQAGAMSAAGLPPTDQDSSALQVLLL